MNLYQVIGRVIYDLDIEVEADSPEEACNLAHDLLFIAAIQQASWTNEDIEVDDWLEITDSVEDDDIL